MANTHTHSQLHTHAHTHTQAHTHALTPKLFSLHSHTAYEYAIIMDCLHKGVSVVFESIDKQTFFMTDDTKYA